MKLPSNVWHISIHLHRYQSFVMCHTVLYSSPCDKERLSLNNSSGSEPKAVKNKNQSFELSLKYLIIRAAYQLEKE